MKILQPRTKKAQHYMAAYARSSMETIFDAYKKPSIRKVEAYEDLYFLCRYKRGARFRIISASNQYFTVGWTQPDGSLRVDTYTNNYIIRPDTIKNY